MTRPPNPLDDAERLLRLDQIGLGSRRDRAAESLDRLTRLASRTLGAPVALVSLVTDERQVFVSQVGLSEPWASRAETPLSHSFCQHAVSSGEPLIVGDARENALLRDNLAIPDLGVVAYAGIPLVVGRQCVGSFCVIDSVPRAWRDEELALLEDLAAAATTELELRWLMAEREVAHERLRLSSAELAQSLARYQALSRSIPGAAVFLFDGERRHLLAEGPVVSDATRGAEPLRRTPVEVFGPELAASVEGFYDDALRGETNAFRAIAAGGRTYDLTITPTPAGGAVAGGMVLALDVTERARLEAEHAALREIAAAVAEGATPEAVLDLVVRRVADLFDAVGAAVFRFDGSAEAALVASAPVAPADLVAGARIPLVATTAVGRIAHTGGPVVVADYGDADDPLVRALRGLGAVGGAAAPIRIRRRLWGALGIGGGNAERLTDETATRLARFAALVATNIENVQAWQALTLQATTDPLTGLPNRRSLVERLRAEIARAGRSHQPLALVQFDIDHFKAINDTHGHLAGDGVLATLAGIAAGEIREGETIARTGGDEFVVLLPGAGIDQALIAAERIRGAVAGADYGDAGSVTISLGAAELVSGDEPDDLIARADKVLYEAKAGGRNAARGGGRGR